MRPLQLVVVRHGVTDWNREGRFQGHLDPPLADLGLEQAALVGRRLAEQHDVRPERIVSSSLSRAMETAAAIGAAMGIEVEGDARLIEIGQGEWEGRTHAELEVVDARRYREWRAASGVRQPPGGEPIAAARARIAELVEELQGAAQRTVCLVSHGGSLRILAQHLLELPSGRSWALDVDNASVGVLTRVESRWRLDRWNDTGHLLGGSPTHVDESEGQPLAL